MKYVRLLFLVVIVLVLGVAFLVLHRADFGRPVVSTLAAVGRNSMQLTAVSGQGSIFQDSARTRAYDVRHADFSHESGVYADKRTAFEFTFAGAVFTALPGTELHFTPQTGELRFEAGEFFWQKKLPAAKLEVALPGSGTILELSRAGRCRIAPAMLEIWSYSGQGALTAGANRFTLNELRQLVLRGNGKTVDNTIPSAAEAISPEERVIDANAESTVVQFKWKGVPGCNNYLLKMFSSPLRETLLYSNTIAANSVNIDMLSIREASEFYWEVYGLDGNGIEGVPSGIGHVIVRGTADRGTLSAQPPELTVTSLSVNGNIVLIKGQVSLNAELFIDNQQVQPDGEGNFFYTISYSSIGTKEIVLRAVVSSGLEAVVRKQVVIYEE